MDQDGLAPSGRLVANGRAPRSSRRNVVVPFLVGTAVGGVAGAVAGILLSHQMTQLVAALIGAIDRRLTDAERDELRFELLLQ
jgi:uncharacterized membrane protein